MNNWYFFGKKIEKLSDYLEGNLDRSKESRIEGIWRPRPTSSDNSNRHKFWCKTCINFPGFSHPNPLTPFCAHVCEKKRCNKAPGFHHFGLGKLASACLCSSRSGNSGDRILCRYAHRRGGRPLFGHGDKIQSSLAGHSSVFAADRCSTGQCLCSRTRFRFREHGQPRIRISRNGCGKSDRRSARQHRPATLASAGV